MNKDYQYFYDIVKNSIEDCPCTFHVDCSDGYTEIRIMYKSGDGFVGCEPSSNDLYIYGLSVVPEKRERGYGTSLIHLCERIAHNLNLSVTLSVRENSWMREWYERIGFEVYDYVKSYVYLKKI